MAEYVKRTWDEATPISAENLNNMETGISYSYSFIKNATAEATPNTMVWRDGSGHSKFTSVSTENLSVVTANVSGALNVGTDITVNNNIGMTGNMYINCADESRIEFTNPSTHTGGLYGNPTSLGLYDWTNRFSIFRYDRSTQEILMGNKKPVYMMNRQGNNEIWWGTEASRPGSGIQFCW